MKFNCIKCGKFICSLDMRKPENKEEYALFCGQCSNENLTFARHLFG
ncbi:MAG: hypothetical protein AABX34_04075 [Nanoarchaeota archaeon]